MSDLTVPSYWNPYRSPHKDCAPGCEYLYWPDAVHPVYCYQSVGRGYTGHTLASGEAFGGALEFAVCVASATRWPKTGETDSCDCREALQERLRHINAVQLHTLLHDDTHLDVDFRPGEARSLAAALTHAADIADGLVAR